MNKAFFLDKEGKEKKEEGKGNKGKFFCNNRSYDKNNNKTLF